MLPDSVNQPKRILILDQAESGSASLSQIFNTYHLSHIFFSTTRTDKAKEIIEKNRIDLVIFQSFKMDPMIQEFFRKISLINKANSPSGGMRCLCIVPDEESTEFIKKVVKDDPFVSYIVTGKKDILVFKTLLLQKAEEKLRKLPQNAALIADSVVSEALPAPSLKATRPEQTSEKIEVIIFGASTGGPKAVTEILPSLCESISVPIIVLIHMPAGFTREFARNLNNRCSYQVQEATHNVEIKPRHIYIAPGTHHLLCTLIRDIRTLQTLNLGLEATYKPSVDLFLKSAADVYGARALTVILTGMGDDGFKGARAMHEKGGPVFLQDEESSVVWGMPGVIARTGLTDYIYPLKEMSQELIKFIKIREMG